jgi:ATP-binding cassette subfamily B protein
MSLMFTSAGAEKRLVPERLEQRLGGLSLDGLVGYAAFDLGRAGAFAESFAVLFEDRLVLVEEQVETIELSTIRDVTVEESIGADRLVLVRADESLIALRYTRRYRRDMTRLQRLLTRRIKPGEDRSALTQRLEEIERHTAVAQHCAKCGQIIPDYSEGVCPRCLQEKKVLWRLLDVARPYRVRLWIGLAVTLLMAVTTSVLPRVNQRMIDDGIIGLSSNMLLTWAGVLAGAIVLTELLGGLRLRLLAMVGTAVSRDLRHKVYAHLHDLSLRFFNKRRTGSLITRVTSDTERLWDFIVFGSVDVLRDVLMIGLVAIQLGLMNWKLAMIALLPLPVIAFVTYTRSTRMHRMFGRLWTYYSRMSGVVGDAIPGVRVVKAFANEQREVKRFDDRSDEYMRKEQEVNLIWSQTQPIVGILMRTAGLLVWVAGGYMHIQNPDSAEWSIGTLTAFSVSLWMFYGPVMQLANSGRMVSRAASSAQRVFEVLDTPPEIYSRTGAVTKDEATFLPKVEFQNVSFSYEGAQPALRDVSLVVEPGTMIGLCGHSGAGKSTFVNLICRFYDVTDGSVLIDGVDVRDYDTKWLRRQIGVVLQEPYLFHGTISENIRYGNPDATVEQVIAAARAANAHDFIVGLPDGYDTIVGERGQSLSGGERQRVSIARAVLSNPKILILDEATSSVDTKTEKQIQEALDRLVKGRTTFAIAHRLSTLEKANLLVVLDKGKVVETGTHAELLARPDGHYTKLHQLQAEMARGGGRGGGGKER